MKNYKFLFLSILFFPLLSNTMISTELEVKSLLDDQLELKVPKAFEIMSEEMMDIKYPTNRRPTLVFTNESGSINVALNLTANPANQDLITPYKDNFIKTFQATYPTAKWKDSGVTEIHGKKVGFLKLITPAVDTKIYNLIFFTDLNDKLLLCTFNCTEKEIEEWKDTGDEILNSLKLK